MTQSPIAPWSQLDEEVEVREAAATSLKECPQVDDFPSSSPWLPDSLPDGAIARRILAAAPWWTLVPLAVAAVWLAIDVISAGIKGTDVSTAHAVGILALILVGGSLLFASRNAQHTALGSIRRAISRKTKRDPTFLEDPPLSPEFQPIWQALKKHTENIEHRVATVLEQQQQLNLDLSLADKQRRNAEAIINSIPHPLLVTNVFDQLILANAAAETVFGFKCKEALRQPIADLISDENLVRMIRQAREADSRAAQRRADLQIGSRTYALTMSPLLLERTADASSSEGHGVVILLRDITQKQDAAKMKSEFVARAAHELRTPLSSIRAYAEMLVDGEAGDEKTKAEYYEIIQTSADRLGRMIDNILNISRIEAGTVRINKEPVAVSMVVKEAVDVARPQAEEKDITLTEELTPVAFRIMADRDMIYQAVLNLLSNAVKYTPEGGKVEVRVIPHEENRTIAIEVKDTGVGIPVEDIPKMFEKFFRVEANKKMAKGTGLGLNLVKNIVETIHEGKMTLASDVGKGSTFGMVLPLMS